MTLPIENNSRPAAGVQKFSNGKETSLNASTSDKTMPPTNFSAFKKVLKRGLVIAFLPFVIGYKVISKSMAEKRFIQDQVLPKLDKAIAEAKKNNQSTTESLVIGSFTIDPIDIDKTEGLSTREILVATLNEMKRKNKAHLEIYREKIKEYIHADFSVTDDKGNPRSMDPLTKRIFVGIEQSALKKITLHNQKMQQEGRPEASKADELIIVQNCIKEEIRTTCSLIENAKKANIEGEDDEKIKALKAKLALLNDYSDAIKTYSALKIIETKIERELEKCELTPVKNFFKALGIMLTTLYFGLMWTPFIPLFALIGLSNAAVVAGTGKDLVGRKYEELEKKNQLAALTAAQSKEETTSTLSSAMITKPRSPPLIPAKLPSKVNPTDESIVTQKQDERTLEELNKIIDRFESETSELQTQHELDKIIESLDDLEFRKERSRKNAPLETNDPYQFIDHLIEKIEKGFVPPP